MQTQQRIVEIARTQFMLYGFRAVTLDQIATAAGISKKTIYQHFKDKDSIVDAVMQLEMIETESNCISFQNHSANAIEEIFLVMRQLSEDLKSINPIVLVEMKKLYPTTWKKFDKMMNETITGMVKSNLQRGIEEGLYRADLDVDILARYRVVSLMMAFDPELFPPQQFNFLKVSAVIMDLFLFGILNEKGFELATQYQQQLKNTNTSI